MRIECLDLDEFFICLDSVSNIYESTIRVSIIRRQLDGPKSVRFDVILQASAVILKDDGTQYLLEMGLNCGRDYLDSTNEKMGTKAADIVRDRISSYADRRQWKTLPGIIHQ